MNAHSPDPRFQEWCGRADAIPIEDVAAQFKLRRSGGDMIGPCPAGCTIHGDGFAVHPKKKIFLCRPSGETGGSIKMLMHAKGLSYIEAVEEITGEERPDRSRDETSEERRDREKQRALHQAEARRRAERDDREAAAARKRNAEHVDVLIKRLTSIQGTLAEAYLRERGMAPHRRLTGDLRFCADLDYWGFADNEAADETLLATLPAMVALIRDVAGDVIGVHQTFLNPREPRKWFAQWEAAIDPKKRRNSAKKIRKRGDTVNGGMIRLGRIGDKLAVGEGIETTLAWRELGCGAEDVTIACGVSLGNISGGHTGTIGHPTRKTERGKPTRVPNGVPDPDRPGMILPPGVRELTLLGDGDSERCATLGALATAAARFIAQGIVVCWHEAPQGYDFNDVMKARWGLHRDKGAQQ